MARQKLDVKSGIGFAPIRRLEEKTEHDKNDVVMIDSSQILDSPYNEGLSMETEDLVTSMKEVGLLEPVIVYALDDGRYQLISGHRRRHAWCQVLGNPQIAAVVRPYEKSAELRLKAHTDANTKTRKQDIDFWTSRIEQAEKLLAEECPELKGEERISRIHDIIGCSRAQYFRYKAFRKTIPEIKKLESNGWITALSLAPVGGLDKEQQLAVYRYIIAMKERFDEKHSLDGDSLGFEVTREELKKIVETIKKAELGEAKAKKTKYEDKLTGSVSALIRSIGKAKTVAEKTAARETIASLRAQLDELERKLK